MQLKNANQTPTETSFCTLNASDGRLNSVSVITPPLESDCLDRSYSGFPFKNEPGRPDSSHWIADLPDSPDSLSNQHGSQTFGQPFDPVVNQRYRANLLNSLNSIGTRSGSLNETLNETLNGTLNNIATHSHLHSGSHRFHPFNQNGSGGGNHASASSASSQASQSLSAASPTDQMPETDCYFPTSNMLDYHLNPAYIGELSPTKCNDYQVNGYTSNYYSRLGAASIAFALIVGRSY